MVKKTQYFPEKTKPQQMVLFSPVDTEHTEAIGENPLEAVKKEKGGNHKGLPLRAACRGNPT
ncbi:MAG: hypothetical protein DRR00_28795 [Candidatus Parabeggiatoa sp. nov. 3]|nr:MAG: hypothetical protein DRR00_28795 [Gammaproteobacteria bacterium]RKZ57282.1 MAG: hypothetical protein DRQ99_27170 [Gammaproteobacteria bacterium]